MLTLAELQRWFAHQIIDANFSPDQDGHGSATGLGTESIAARVLPSAQLSPEERLAIYQEAYRLRLIECLSDDYPALLHALGESAFRELVLAYIAAHPSRSPNLNAFGRQLSAFCRDHGGADAAATNGEGARAAVPRFAADLAELEWALVDVLHAPSLPRLSSEALASIAPEQWPNARFVAAPTLRVVSTRFAVNAYYQAFRQDEAPLVPEECPSATAVFRDGLSLWRMNLTKPMELLLGSLLSGHTLGEAFAGLSEAAAISDDDGPKVMAWFREWVGHGFFVDIRLINASEPQPGETR
jgi:hypothetical protein